MKTYKKHDILQGFIFLCITIIASLYIISGITVTKNIDYIVIITFLINGVIIITQLIKISPLGYCLNDMVWIYMLGFMILAPLIQYLTQDFPWWNTDLLTNQVLIYSNIIITIFLTIYLITQRQYRIKKKKNKRVKFIGIVNQRIILEVIFWGACLASIYIIYKTGVNNLFSRSTNIISVDETWGLIVKNTFNAIPIIGISLHMCYKNANNKFYKKYQLLILCIMGLVVNFPTGIPRFKMAAIYIGLILVFKNRFKNKYIFKYIIIFGLIYIFPLINIFRGNTMQDVINLNISSPDPASEFVTGNFDSYSMLSRSILYARDNGITWGNQLLGSMLFFIPRAVWTNKPIGSGAMLGNSFGWDFTNVSCPFIGEGYINFGLIGVGVFSLILAIIIIHLQSQYELQINTVGKKLPIIKVLYPFMLGFLFFILRGDLLSSLSFTIGFCIPVIAILLLDKLIIAVRSYRNR